MLGLGREGERVRRIASDQQGRMRSDALREALSTIEGPTIVCAQAGNVNTGAFDPLDELIPIAHERGAWIHVDGAFGIWAAAVPSMRDRMRGYEAADSWSTDAHKWLNVPYDSGLVFVRDRSAHHAAMTLGAEYYVETAGGERDNYNWVPESSRRARGFTVLAALRSLGRSGLVDLIERDCAHARRMAERLAAGPRVSILNDVVLTRCSSVRRTGWRHRRFAWRHSDPGGDRRGPARRDVLAGWDRVGRPRGDACLGLRLADERGRHRDVRRHDPALCRGGRSRGVARAAPSGSWCAVMAVQRRRVGAVHSTFDEVRGGAAPVPR
jgi:Glutamate decarboxylase and related PLP-dependent proteins